MKKILIFLMFSVFFSSCPIMEDTNEQAVWLLIKNKSAQVLNLNFKFEVSSWSGHCFDVYEEDLKGDSISNIQGFSYKEKPQNPFDFLMAECIKKQIVVTSLSGDTLANWNDTSAVFDPQYWNIEPLKSGDIHCTLQLTDEVLKLK